MSESKWKPYPNYKSSKSPVGTLPTSWEEIRFRLLFGTQKGKIPSLIHSEPLPDSIPYVSMEYLREGTISQHVTPGKGSVIVEEDDLIILWDGSNAGEILKSKFGILSSTAAKILPKNDECRDFDFFCLKSLEPIIKSGNTGMGIPHVDGQFLKDLILPRPSLIERQKIAKFLNHRTERIDTVITRLNQKLFTIKEQRSTLFAKAVTKGLDPDVDQKDSGVGWIGEIPKHWSLKRIKHIFKIHNGATPKSGNPDYWEGEMNWVTPDDLGSLQGIEIEETSRKITPYGYASCGVSIAKAGSIAISTRAPIGHLAIITSEMSCNQGCRLLEPINETEIKYFHAYLEAAGKELESWGQGSTFKELTRHRLENFPVLLPPPEELIELSQFLNKNRVAFAAAIRNVTTEIEKLNLFRNSLISAAVTGKIDVRELGA